MYLEGDDADWRDARWLGALVPKHGCVAIPRHRTRDPVRAVLKQTSSSEPPQVADLDNR